MEAPLAERLVVLVIRPPVFVKDMNGCDISVHASVEDARLHIEPTDVENEEYIAYDSEGRLLTLSVVEDKRTRLPSWGRERVVLDQAEEEPTHEQELRMALLDYLKCSGLPEKTYQSLPLRDIIERFIEICGFSK